MNELVGLSAKDPETTSATEDALLEKIVQPLCQRDCRQL
jgi:hypothetical protein